MIDQFASNTTAECSADRGEVVLYESPDGGAALQVRLARETVWLTQAQIADLFQRERSVITKHLRNIFKEGELAERDNVQKMHIVGSNKPVALFNLDVIISVGYRVKSKRGTQFRIWATNVLRQHLIQGYTANERRLGELRRSLRLVERALDHGEVSADEAHALLHVVADYAYALDLLDDYDHQRVAPGQGAAVLTQGISVDEAHQVIGRLRAQFGASELFGREKDASLASSLAAVMQTFDGQDVYPTVEDKAAHLLYFVVKNHSFVDGNKRIAAALFLWFLEKNGRLYRAEGDKRIADNALVAITLMIAVSDPAERDTLCRMVVHLINERN